LTERTARTDRQASREPRPVPAYLLFLTALTVLYLLVEVPFAAYLVQLLGSEADHADIERAEQCGRIISGAALALAVWGWQIPRYRARKRGVAYSTMACLLSAALCVSGVYYGEKALVDQIAANAPAHTRQQALAAVAVRNELFSSGVEGVDPSARATGDGPWRAFVGLFPFLSMQDPDVLDRTVSGRDAVIAAAVDKLVPSQQDFRDIAYDGVIEVWRERFIAYREAVHARTRALGPVRDEVERGWNRHVQNMRYHGVIGSGRTTARAVRRVVSDVQNAGVPVPDNWDPTDQVTFQRKAFGKLMPRVDGPYNDAVTRIVGEPMTPEVEDFETFLKQGAVQKGMRKDLGLAPYDGMVVPDMHGEAFDRLYRAYVAGFSRELRAVYTGDPSELGRGRKFDEVAQAAVRSVWVPVLALSLSLAGAAGHLLKLSNYLAYIILSAKRSRIGITALLRRSFILRMGAIGSLASALVMAAYVPANAIVDSPYYREASQGVVERYGPQVGQGLEWTISWQSTLVPAGTAARSLGVFLPLESYLVGDTAEASPAATPSVALVDVPMPIPRPASRVAAVEAGGVTIPFPRPRPANR